MQYVVWLLSGIVYLLGMATSLARCTQIDDQWCGWLAVRNFTAAGLFRLAPSVLGDFWFYSFGIFFGNSFTAVVHSLMVGFLDWRERALILLPVLWGWFGNSCAKVAMIARGAHYWECNSAGSCWGLCQFGVGSPMSIMKFCSSALPITVADGHSGGA